MARAVKLTFLPENVDSTIDAIRNLGEKTQEAMLKASRATRGLGEDGAKYREEIERANQSISKHEKVLMGLASQHTSLADKIKATEHEYDRLLAAYNDLQEQGPGAGGPVVWQAQLDLLDQDIAKCAGKLKELDAAFDSTTEKIDDESEALQDSVEALDAARKATDKLREAKRKEAEEAKKAKEAAKQQKQQEKELAQEQDASRKMSMALAQAQSALSRLMRGDLVGAAKSATSAFKQMTSAMGANPKVAGWIAVTAAITAAIKVTKDIIKVNDEYVQKSVDGLNKVQQAWSARWGREHPQEPGGLSDSDLDRKIKVAQSQYLTAKDRADEAALNVQFASEDLLGPTRKNWFTRTFNPPPAGNWLRRKFSWLPGVEDPAEVKEEADKDFEMREEAEKKAKERLDALTKERERRRKKEEEEARKAEEEAVKRANEQIRAGAERQRRREGDEIEGRLGRVARMEFDKQNLQRDYENETDPEKRAKIEDRIYETERKITEERRKQAEEDAKRELDTRQKSVEKSKGVVAGLEFRRNALQKQLDDTTNLEKRRELEAEILALNEKITNEKDKQAEKDARDAQLAAEKKEAAWEAQYEWGRGRKLDKMSAADRVRSIQAEIDNLRQFPRNPENEARMRKLIDERDAAKKDADALDEKKQDFFHRHDTDAQKMARVRSEILKAGASGDQAKMLELMMEGESLVSGVRDSNMSWVDRKKAARQAKKQARADREAADEMEDFLEGIEGGSESNTLRARSARRMGGKLNGFSRHPNGMAARSAARMAAMRAGTLRDYRPGAKGPSSSAKSEEAKGIDKTNNLLEDIKKALQ